MNDTDFLRWVAARHVNVHKESPSADFVHKLLAIAETLPSDQDTPALQHKADLCEGCGAFHEYGTRHHAGL